MYGMGICEFLAKCRSFLFLRRQKTSLSVTNAALTITRRLRCSTILCLSIDGAACDHGGRRLDVLRRQNLGFVGGDVRWHPENKSRQFAGSESFNAIEHGPVSFQLGGCCLQRLGRFLAWYVRATATIYMRGFQRLTTQISQTA